MGPGIAYRDCDVGGIRHMAGAASGTACGADSPGELVRIVETVERREIVAAAGVVLAVLACTEHDTAIVAGRGLARLHIEVIGVHRDFSTDGDATIVISQVVCTGREAKRVGEEAELAAR